MTEYPNEIRERFVGTPEQHARGMVGEPPEHLERAGFRLPLREPWWFGHRMLITPDADVHLHVWPVGAAQPIRHRLFRDRLRDNPADRDLHAATKRSLIERIFTR